MGVGHHSFALAGEFIIHACSTNLKPYLRYVVYQDKSILTG